jgi:hypothetical protein
MPKHYTSFRKLKNFAKNCQLVFKPWLFAEIWVSKNPGFVNGFSKDFPPHGFPTPSDVSWTSWGEHGISVIREYEIPGNNGQGIVKQHFGNHAMSLCTKGMGKGGAVGVTPGAGPPPVAAVAAVGVGPPPVAAVAAVAKAAAVAVGKEGDFKRRKKWDVSVLPNPPLPPPIDLTAVPKLPKLCKSCPKVVPDDSRIDPGSTKTI